MWFRSFASEIIPSVLSMKCRGWPGRWSELTPSPCRVTSSKLGVSFINAGHRVSDHECGVRALGWATVSGNRSLSIAARTQRMGAFVMADGYGVRVAGGGTLAASHD